MVLIQKWPILQLFFLGNIGQENVFYDILERVNAFLGYKNKKIKNSKNWHFSKGVNPWFWSKNGLFSNFLYLGNIGHENVFYNILDRKNAFLGYKNNKFKKSKKWHFSKGVNPGFGPKMALFPNFFPGNIGLKNVFYDILKQKNAFLAYKNNKFKKSKNWHFSKRVNPWFGPKVLSKFKKFFKGVNPRFWSKYGLFSNFLLGNIGQKKVFYDILE